MSAWPWGARPKADRLRAMPIVLALLASVLATALAFQFVDVRSDMADFLPAGDTPAARLMLQQLRSGAATSLILVGLDGAAPDALARISRTMAQRLDASGLFSFVDNGATGLDPADEAFLFARRYLLSPATDASAFSAAALHSDLERLLDQLQSSAAPLAERYGLADPVGAFLALGRVWIGESAMRSIDGVWFAPDRDRALLLARTRAGGLDLGAQDAADAAIRAAFAAAEPGGARLLAAGPAVFARDAARAIRGDVQLLSIVSTLLVAALLLWRFRSIWVIAAIAVPITLSIGAAALAVQAMFGFVHGITLGFGMTMLGVTVDYPVLLIGHRKQAEAPPATLARIGFSFNMAVLTAALGLTGMACSGFPGVAQLGTFALAGLLVAAATTRWLLPRLVAAADLAPVSAGDPTRLLRIEAWRRYRAWGAAPVIAAAAMLLMVPPRAERDLAALSPVPQAARDLDAELRREIGAPDVGQIAMVTGANAETVLRREEALLPTLDQLQRDGVLAGSEIAARLLPSAATQRARRDALPEDAVLAARLAAARDDLGFRADAFAAFTRDVAVSRSLDPVTLADIRSPMIAARLEPLLFAQGGGWAGLVVPRGLVDATAFAGAMAGRAGVTSIDIGRETNAVVAAATVQAWRWLALGGVAAMTVLCAGLRSVGQVARVLAALAAAGLVTLAALGAMGQRISLIHIVSLQLAAGVGLDYALFFARRQLDDEERARTLRTLVTCNAMTLLTFGLLAFCRTPLLRQIGVTVAIGALAAISFAFLFVGDRFVGVRRVSDRRGRTT